MTQNSKRPSFQFYPYDWKSDLKLRRCSPAARGVWMDVLCAFHDSDDAYGLLRWSLKEIVRTIGASKAHVQELVDKGVLRGSDTQLAEALVYVPRSGRKTGPPVTLIPEQAGPIWYSKRLVTDEYVRTIRGEASRFGGHEDDSPAGPPATSPTAAPTPAPKTAPKPASGAAPKPPFGDGSSTPSPSPASPENPATSGEVAGARPAAEPPPAPPPPDPFDGGDAAPPAAPAPPGSPPPAPPKLPDCPHLDLLNDWAEILPDMPRHDPEHWGGTRADHLRARWRETAAKRKWSTQQQGRNYFRRLFAHCALSPFLMGKTTPTMGRRPFQFELEWLVNPSNWARVHEGKYHETETP